MPPIDEAQARWFVEHVLPHNAQLRGYLRGSFPAVCDVDDVVQESYLRVWRAGLTRPIVSSRAFLFTVARRVVLDLVRRARRSPINDVGAASDVAALHVAHEAPPAAELLGEQEKIDLLGAAIAALPARCREIIVLHKIQGFSQRDVAARLGLREKTVENHVALGVKRCGTFFRARGIEFF